MFSLFLGPQGKMRAAIWAAVPAIPMTVMVVVPVAP
jgi:hypothetical protein